MVTVSMTDTRARAGHEKFQEWLAQGVELMKAEEQMVVAPPVGFHNIKSVLIHVKPWNAFIKEERQPRELT